MLLPLFACTVMVSWAFKIVDSPVEQLIWCGQQQEMFLLTARGTLYKGANQFVNESAKFVQQQSSFTAMEVLQSPANSSVLFIIGDGDTSFYTLDCGRNYTMFQHDAHLYDFKLNSMDASQIMAFKDTKCKNGTLCKDKYKKQMYISSNYGQYWFLALERVRDANWDKLLEAIEIPDNRIVASHLHSNGSLLVSYSDDYYQNHVPIRWNSYGYYQTKEYLFALIDADALSKGYDLEVTKAYQFNLAEVFLPIEDHEKYTFTVLDTVNGSIFMSVSHSQEIPKVTNIYKSDVNGSQYTLSLVNNVRSLDTGTCDFEPIIDGIYMANIYDNGEFEKFKQRRTSKNLDALQRLENYKQTRVTFDKGGEWHPLKAPKYDYKGQPLKCGGDCSLHLLGRSEAFRNSIQSNSHIVIGSGNTGIFLGEQSNTYLSRDGGHTWFEIIEGIHVYEIGDNKGVIVFVKDDEQAHEILYTWDEGQTFHKLSMNITFDITSLVFRNDTFIIYGIQDSKTLHMEEDISESTLKGVVVVVPLKDIMVKKCQGFDDPGSNESDYEYWSPTNFAGDRCIFGRKLKYIRRKRLAACYNEQAEIPITSENCPCTKEDWECDIGFSRNINGECIPLKKIPAKQCRGQYMKSQGYRKIPGDECQGGVDLGPIEVDCDQEDQISSTNKDTTSTGQQQTQQQQSVEVPEPPRKRNKHSNKETTANTEGGFNIWYLLIGVVLFAGSVILKKRISKPQQPKQSKQYYPAKQSEKQSLFADL